jgi:Yip1 domain
LAIRAAPAIVSTGALAHPDAATYTWARRPIGRRTSAAAAGAVMDVVERAKAIILSPGIEWRRIEPESGDAGYLFANYAAFLAAIPPVCHFLRDRVFGWAGPRLHHLHHGGFFSSLFGGIVRYLVTFAVLYAMAVIIDGLAPTFSAPKNQPNAMKLAVYSMTPIWLAGVFALIPGLGFLRLVALAYGVYVFWLGLPILMKSPPDKTGPYVLTAIVCAIILAIVISAIVGPVL